MDPILQRQEVDKQRDRQKDHGFSWRHVFAEFSTRNAAQSQGDFNFRCLTDHDALVLGRLRFAPVCYHLSFSPPDPFIQVTPSRYGLYLQKM